jgi:hypothetical protein
LNEKYSIIFRGRSIFFSLIRKEIVKRINYEFNDLSILKKLKILLVLHDLLSITGKIILSTLIILISLFVSKL